MRSRRLRSVRSARRRTAAAALIGAGGLGIGVAAIALLTAGATALGAQTSGSPERFTALAVNMSNIGRGGSTTVEIGVTRWSTDAERDQLITTVLEQTPQKAINVLQKMPRAGFIRSLTSIGWDLHYARRTRLPEGGERIVLLTDRFIGFWEATNQPRSIDYPFTLIEMEIDKDGKGSGKLYLATKITGDAENRFIVIEDFADQPILLNSVSREKSK